jgi:hypothetical protein
MSTKPGINLAYNRPAPPAENTTMTTFVSSYEKQAVALPRGAAAPDRGQTELVMKTLGNAAPVKH